MTVSYKTKYIGILQSSNAAKKTSTEMYTAASSIVAQTWKQPRDPLTGEQWYSHALKGSQQD